ncbi:MAG: urease accessory UreF family protein [Burkholderiales bacterium]|nr:urease accessory UreF family protein [Burkholderiales bacterium]
MSLQLARLLQLVSPTLPVGAYTYSQGLEAAVEAGAVRDEASAAAWIGTCLEYGVASGEAVYLAHMLRAWQMPDTRALQTLNEAFLASRESAELYAETVQMGYSLMRLLSDLPGAPGQALADFDPVSLPLAWSCAATAWEIAEESAVMGYLWTWLENQVMAAVKLIPLGQTAGQRLLVELGARLPQLAHTARSSPLEAASNWLPGLAIASSRHETQYTRLFRS